MKIYIAADHAGYTLKQKIIAHFHNLDFVDLGTDSEDAVDYPYFVRKLCEHMIKDNDSMGILVCGSGQGVCIGANRYKNIRAVACDSMVCAEITREHNNANVLCLGARYIDEDTAYRIIDVFMNTSFSNEPRHHRRVEALDTLGTIK